MNTTKTLIILTPGFPADEMDTSCLPSLQLFVKSCKEDNPSLKVIVLAFQYPFKSSTYTWNDVTIISFNGRNKGRMNRLLVWVKVWRALLKIKSNNDVTGILSFWLGECALLGTYFSKLKNLKHFTWILGQDAKKSNRYHWLIKPSAYNLVALSDFVAQEYFKNYGKRPEHIIPIGIDTSLFSVSDPIRDIDIMGAGNLIPLKRYNLFVGVVSELVAYFPKIHTVICGKGIEKVQLLKQLKEAGLENNITLLDELPHKEVLQLMQRSKVFFHPSGYEGYGAVCAEALYAGANVVSFCKPMNNCSTQHKIVATKDEAFDTILKILQDNRRTHERVLDHSIKKVSKQMLDLFIV